MGDEPRLVPMTITDDEARLAVQVVELQAENARLRAQIRLALDQLGVPTPDYPAPIAYVVEILNAALSDEGGDE